MAFKTKSIPTVFSRPISKIFNNMAGFCFSTFMAEKTKKSNKPKAKPVAKPKAKKITRKTKKPEEHIDDIGIVIVDDDITIDKEKVNEERRAYLEEARSQEAFD